MIWNPFLVVRSELESEWVVERERKHIDVLLCYFITTTTPITTFSNYSIIATYIIVYMQTHSAAGRKTNFVAKQRRRL